MPAQRWVSVLRAGRRSAGGYLSLALAQRLLNDGEEPAAIVCVSPLTQIAKAPKIKPCRLSGGGNKLR